MQAPTEGNMRIVLGENGQKDGHVITFLDVVEDSRCPANVDCVWQGRVTVELEIDDVLVHLSAPNGQSSDQYPTMAEQGEIQVWVIDVRPRPGTAEARNGAPVEVEVMIGSAMR